MNYCSCFGRDRRTVGTERGRDVDRVPWRTEISMRLFITLSRSQNVKSQFKSTSTFKLGSVFFVLKRERFPNFKRWILLSFFCNRRSGLTPGEASKRAVPTGNNTVPENMRR